MKSILKITTLLIAFIILGCGGGEKQDKQEKIQLKKQKTTKKIEVKKEVKASKTIDLTNKGVGPISSVTLTTDINQTQVSHGKEIFNKMCTACHRLGKKFIGPPPNGILKRRTPEWIMNMILEPEQMVQNDPLARKLLMEFNGSPMANQSLTKDEARDVLEYFRTLN